MVPPFPENLRKAEHEDCDGNDRNRDPRVAFDRMTDRPRDLRQGFHIVRAGCGRDKVSEEIRKAFKIRLNPPKVIPNLQRGCCISGEAAEALHNEGMSYAGLESIRTPLPRRFRRADHIRR
jgi:hypothetical protein